MRKLIILLAVFGTAFGVNYENANKLVDGEYCGKTVSMKPCLYTQAFKKAVSYKRSGNDAKAKEAFRNSCFYFQQMSQDELDFVMGFAFYEKDGTQTPLIYKNELEKIKKVCIFI